MPRFVGGVALLGVLVFLTGAVGVLGAWGLIGGATTLAIAAILDAMVLEPASDTDAGAELI